MGGALQGKRWLAAALALSASWCTLTAAQAQSKALPAEVEDNWDEIMRLLPGGEGKAEEGVREVAARPAEPAAEELASGSARRKSKRDPKARGASGEPSGAEPSPSPKADAPPEAAPEPNQMSEAERAWLVEEAPTKAGRPARKQTTSKKPPRDERTKPIKRGVSAGYQALRAQWHAPAPTDQTYLSDSTPALVFQVVGEPAPFVVLVPEEKGGPFDAEQLEVARGAFRGGPESRVNERLLGLIHRATRHFEVPYVTLVSGIRRDRGASRHTHGLAADIVLPGVEDEDLADFFRVQGFIGVGVYTRAGFVHVDVRDRSFFWVDPSPPGKSMKIRPVRMDEAKAADEAAVARGEEPFVNPPRLSRALAKRSAKKRAKRTEAEKIHKKRATDS